MHRANRALWLCIGFILLASGIAGVLAGQGLFGASVRTKTLPASWPQQLAHPDAALLLGLGLGGAVVFLLGLLLLRAQIALPRVGTGSGTLRLPRAGSAAAPAGGATRVRRAALQHGLVRDLERLPQVQSVNVAIDGALDHLDLRVVLETIDVPDLARLRSDIQDALQRFAATVGGCGFAHVEVTLRLREENRRVA
jgi:hypothetical protein